MKILFDSAIQCLQNTKTLLIGLFENFDLNDGRVSILEQNSNNFLSKAIDINEFKGKKGENIVISTPGIIKNNENIIRIVFIGLGKQSEFDQLASEKIGSKIVDILKKHKIEDPSLLIEDIKEDYIPSIALGALLNNYTFQKYKTKLDEKEKFQIKSMTLIADNVDYVNSIFSNKIEPVQKGIYFARNLVTEPANELNPESYANIIKDLNKEFSDLKIEVLDEKAMQGLGMNALLGVGQGSKYQSRLVVLKWCGAEDKNEQPVALVGKGVTFDTGGISIKPSRGMWEMIYDMAGSASVVGTMYTLAARKAKVNVIGIVGLVENAVSGTAQRPGDIVKSMSGQTIEVLNTDAEGRLVLADAIWYAQKQLPHKPKAIIDLATLTGAVVVALGSNCYAGLFSNNDELSKNLIKSGEASGEKVWRFPLAKEYDKQMDSNVADMKNISLKGYGADSITAAQFLQRFIEDEKTPWAHLDIAGMAWTKESLTSTPKGATGFGVKLLNQFLLDHFESK